MSVATALSDTVNPRLITEIGFGEIRFRTIYRDSGNNYTLPDWQSNPRINRISIPGGGIYAQRNGYDADTLSLRVELQTVADAASLRSMTGYLDTLVLPDDPYSTRGSLRTVHGVRYRYISDVLLASVDAAEGITVRGNYPRVVLTFEMNRLQ